MRSTDWRRIFLVLVFTLPVMQPNLSVLGSQAVLADALLVVTGIAFIANALKRRLNPSPAPLFWSVAAYALACVLSAVFSTNIRHSLHRLPVELDVLAIGALSFYAIDSEAALKRFGNAWLLGTVVTCVAGVLATALFYAGARDPQSNPLIGAYGTFVPGPYPRIRALMLFHNSTCHYLAISLCIAVAMHLSGWLSKKRFLVLAFAILAVAALTLSPGLGGIALSFGLLVALFARRPALRVASLVAGTGAAFLMLVRSAISAGDPLRESWFSALYHGNTIASPRIGCATAAVKAWLTHPWLGSGLGTPIECPTFVDPSGVQQYLSDAHNLFLSTLVQKGVIGLIPLTALVLWLLFRPARRPTGAGRHPIAVWRSVLAVALLQGFFYQGLTGSFEHQRHLWVIIGALGALA